MKPLEGFKIIECTDNRIVQEQCFGKTGVIRVVGNPTPRAEEHQEAINDIAKILYKGYLRGEEQPESELISDGG